MKNKICFVYPWATFGGVERILINRAIAFQKAAPFIEIHLFFQHDAGGLDVLRSAIESYGLDKTLIIVNQLDGDQYDAIGVIDSPDIVSLCHTKEWPYFVECHTAYEENQRYLKTLPDSCRAVCVPSSHFKLSLEKKHPHVLATVLRNFVPAPLFKEQRDCGIPAWPKQPILFLGRQDNLKNPIELLEAYSLVSHEQPDQFLLILCGSPNDEIEISKEIRKRTLSADVLRLPPMPFKHTGNFMAALAQKKGIFVSPSRAESFGLSAAEAISFGMGVVLSDIEAHRSLVQGDKKHLYQLGSARELANKIIEVSQEGSNLEVARKNLSIEGFLSDWNRFWSNFS